MLDALRRAEARATFFVLGERVEEHPALVARTIEDGHAVQIHGHAHLRHPRAGQAAVAADLGRVTEALRAHGVDPGWWRVPWGDLAGFTPLLAAAAGLRLAGWTADTHDWRGDATPEMLAAVRDELRPGAVVLAHDGIGPGAEREDAAATAALVEPLVAAVREAGLEPVPMDAGWRSPVPAGNPAAGRGVPPPSADFPARGSG